MEDDNGGGGQGGRRKQTQHTHVYGKAPGYTNPLGKYIPFNLAKLMPEGTQAHACRCGHVCCD